MNRKEAQEIARVAIRTWTEGTREREAAQAAMTGAEKKIAAAEEIIRGVESLFGNGLSELFPEMTGVPEQLARAQDGGDAPRGMAAVAVVLRDEPGKYLTVAEVSDRLDRRSLHMPSEGAVRTALDRLTTGSNSGFKKAVRRGSGPGTRRRPQTVYGFEPVAPKVGNA